MEDMCQLTERLTERKYKGSYEQIAKAIRQYSHAPGLDLTNYWIMVVFCWLVGNSDMHLKNFSLYAPNTTEHVLAPAYDLVNTLLAIPEDNEELALTLNGKKRKLTRHDFETAMLSSGLNAKVVSNIFRKFLRIYPQWEATIRASFLPEDLQEAYWQLIQSGRRLFLRPRGRQFLQVQELCQTKKIRQEYPPIQRAADVRIQGRDKHRV